MKRRMRGALIVELLALGVTAQETTSLFLPYFSPGHPLLASIVDADHTATTYSIACSIYEPTLPNGCRVPIPFYLTSGPTFMHATMSLPSTSEIRTHITTRHSIPHASEYLYLFPAYTEDAYCQLLPTAASCLVTATGGALTVPTFTNRRTLDGEGFWGGWREAVVTDVMPRSYSSVETVEEEERVWTKSVVSDIPQTRDVVGENSASVKTPARTVAGVVPKETGGRGAVGERGAMTTTAMSGSETDVKVEGGGAGELGEGDTDTLIVTETVSHEITETAIVAETVVVTELTVVADADSRVDGRKGVVKEDL